MKASGYNLDDELDGLAHLLARQHRNAGELASTEPVTAPRREQLDLRPAHTKLAILQLLDPETVHTLNRLYTRAHGLDRAIHYTRYLQTFMALRERVGESAALDDFVAEAERARRDAEPGGVGVLRTDASTSVAFPARHFRDMITFLCLLVLAAICFFAARIAIRAKPLSKAALADQERNTKLSQDIRAIERIANTAPRNVRRLTEGKLIQKGISEGLSRAKAKVYRAADHGRRPHRPGPLPPAHRVRPASLAALGASPHEAIPAHPRRALPLLRLLPQARAAQRRARQRGPGAHL